MADMCVIMADVWIMSADYEGGHVIPEVYENVWIMIMRSISEGAHYFRNYEQWN